MKAQLLLSLGLAGLIAVVSGCGPKEEPASNGTTGSPTPSAEKQTLTVKGSDTMVQLAQAWAQEFMKANPNISVSVTGGGSSTGFAALFNKTTEVANASRQIKSEETEKAKGDGVEVKEFEVAQDALSIVVNPSNPIKELTMAQLKDIYTGKVTNWKALGGQDKNIIAVSRESSSGTFVFFQEHVLNKEPFAASVQLSPATSQIVDNVAQDAGAIGYVGLGYMTDKIKAIPIKKDATSPAIPGTSATVLDKSYPLARALYEYTNGEPTGAVKTWLDWILSAEGQKIVEDLGFVPVAK
ncbi:MAG: phosphate ABC transporter substrate-binding protein [Fimbriimonadaceae bacterium]